jgi:predicted NBD/HSP70 family sugar kinase
VLERLHLDGPASRSVLARTTGLNRSTIADLVGELTELGLVDEQPALVTSGPGRPSPVVHPRPEGAIALAIELAVDSIAVATIGLGGHVFDRRRVMRGRGHSPPEEAVEEVAKLAGPLLETLPSEGVLTRVGVAVAGLARRSDGFVHLAPNLGWRDVPLARLIAAELGAEVDVLVGNEADLGALAELRRGARPGVQHLVYVSGEVGIGVGVIADGKPLSGAAGYAGEAGHTLVNPAGQRCRCGAVGCWETEAGEAALLRHAGLGDRVEDLDELVERATAGDGPTRRALADVGRWLGLGIGDLINVFNPELVVLGGLFERVFAYLEDAVAEGVSLRVLDPPGELATITPSALGSDASLLGAAELVLSDVMMDPARAVGQRHAGHLADAGRSRT